jgi:aspartyl-tRNA(Asn)/glutamyl-tRNA(Gln) amidotransferase subunit A
MASHDAMDSTSADIPVPDYESGLNAGVKGLRVGIPKEYRVDGAPSEIDALWAKGAEWLKAQGAEIVEVSLPHTKYALAAYYIVAPAEASSNLARYDGVRYGRRTEHANDLIELYEKSRAEGFGREVLRRIMIGTYVLSAGYYDAYYLRAQRVRNLIARDFTDAFKRCDILLAPITPCTAFALGEKTADPVSMYLTDVFTVPLNLAGLPGLSVPAGLSNDGLPLGLQVIGKAFDEATVLRAGRALEIAADFRGKPHTWWTTP